jgi:hypothetical protein
MPMTRRQGITNRSKAKSQNARKRGPTPGFPAKSNTLSRQLLPIAQADLHSSRTTTHSTKKPRSNLRGFFFVTDQPPQVRVRIRIMKLS